MLSNNCSILLIDDDADVLDAYTQLLEQAGYHVSACNNPFDAREQVPKDWPGIVLSDVCMPGCSGIDLMTLFHQDDDLLPILLITGHGDVPMAVEAVKKGAWDFLQKPIDPGKLLTLVDAALRQRQSVIARRQYCQQKLQVELIGRSQWTVRYRQRLQQLAETDIAVWLYGEPGTGRMTGARYLHQLGRHAEGPFIACELTPANAHTLNELIAQAQGGTLVLSHPEHLTHEQQHQLVQLQSHEKRPFRLIGIGSASLVELAASSQIVAELYYCFAMTQIGCQPLSKRPDDIEPLFHHYLQKTCQRLNHPVPEVDAGLLKGMMRRVWPNNVRELANAAELFAVGVLPLAETVNPLMHIGEPTPLDQRVEDVERQIITEALNIHQGRINEVAEYLLIPRKTIADAGIEARISHVNHSVAGHNIDFNIGIAIHKSGHDRRKQKICRFNGCIDADTTGRGIAIPVKRFKRAFYGVERLKNRLNQFLTSCRRGDALGRAIKQANPEPGFQPLQGMTQR